MADTTSDPGGTEENALAVLRRGHDTGPWADEVIVLADGCRFRQCRQVNGRLKVEKDVVLDGHGKARRQVDQVVGRKAKIGYRVVTRLESSPWVPFLVALDRLVDDILTGTFPAGDVRSGRTWRGCAEEDLPAAHWNPGLAEYADLMRVAGDYGRTFRVADGDRRWEGELTISTTFGSSGSTEVPSVSWAISDGRCRRDDVGWFPVAAGDVDPRGVMHLRWGHDTETLATAAAFRARLLELVDRRLRALAGGEEPIPPPDATDHTTMLTAGLPDLPPSAPGEDGSGQVLTVLRRRPLDPDLVVVVDGRRMTGWASTVHRSRTLRLGQAVVCEDGDRARTRLDDIIRLRTGDGYRVLSRLDDSPWIGWLDELRTRTASAEGWGSDVGIDVNTMTWWTTPDDERPSPADLGPGWADYADLFHCAGSYRGSLRFRGNDLRFERDYAIRPAYLPAGRFGPHASRLTWAIGDVAAGHLDEAGVMRGVFGDEPLTMPRAEDFRRTFLRLLDEAIEGGIGSVR